MLNRTWSLFFPLVLLAAVTLLLGFMLTAKEIKVLYSEDHLIESATVLGYGLALLLLIASSRLAWRLRLLGGVVLLLCAARELDAHKAFTAESCLKISYSSGCWPTCPGCWKRWATAGRPPTACWPPSWSCRSPSCSIPARA